MMIPGSVEHSRPYMKVMLKTGPENTPEPPGCLRPVVGEDCAQHDAARFGYTATRVAPWFAYVLSVSPESRLFALFPGLTLPVPHALPA